MILVLVGILPTAVRRKWERCTADIGEGKFDSSMVGDYGRPMCPVAKRLF